jgi:hypothetical protein
VVGVQIRAPESHRDDVLIGHRWCLPVLVQQLDLLSSHRLVGHSRRKSRGCSLAPRSGGTTSTGHRDVAGDVGSLIGFARHDGVGGGESQ